MTWRRLLPALVLGPLLFWVASLDAFPWYLLAVVPCAAWGSIELYHLLVGAGYRPLWGIGILLAVGVAADAVLTQWHLLPHLLGGASLLGLLWVTFDREHGYTLTDWALTLPPALYVGLLLGYYPLLRQRPDGGFWVQLVLVTTWAADTGAYLVGRRWGRTRLAPALSPGKSLEGAAAWLVCAVLAALVAAALAAAPGRPAALMLGTGVLSASAGLAGDLAESWLKRQLGVKDSSGLLLGHGGLLDRMDSLLVTGMVAYYYYLATLGG